MAPRRRFLRRWTRGGGSPPAPEPTLRIQPLESGEGYRLGGDLDLFSVGALRAALETVSGTLVVDLGEVEFMDDSGLGQLLQVLRRLREGGGSLVLRDPRDDIRRVFEITGPTWVDGLTIEPEARPH